MFISIVSIVRLLKRIDTYLGGWISMSVTAGVYTCAVIYSADDDLILECRTKGKVEAEREGNK